LGVRAKFREVGLWEAIDCFPPCLTVGTEDVSVGRTVNSDGCRVLGTYWDRIISGCGGQI